NSANLSPSERGPLYTPLADARADVRRLRFCANSRREPVQQKVLVRFQRRLSCVAGLAATTSFGASTILGSRICEGRSATGLALGGNVAAHHFDKSGG